MTRMEEEVKSSVSKPLYKFPLAVVINYYKLRSKATHIHSFSILGIVRSPELVSTGQNQGMDSTGKNMCSYIFFQILELHLMHFVAHGSFSPLYSKHPS